MTDSLTVATWNIHRGVGMDRRFRPDRIVRVLAEIDADVIALQEVGGRDVDFDMISHLAEASGHGPVAGVTFRDRHGDFGNALLSRLPIIATDQRWLRVGDREPRLALVTELERARGPLRVVVTHLGLSVSERHTQVAQLIELLRDLPSMPTILAGDMNAWSRGKPESRPLDSWFGAAPRVATFPSLAPCVALDRIWMHANQGAMRLRAHSSRTARLASDHLPLVADIELSE